MNKEITITEKLAAALERARDREKDLKRLGGPEKREEALRLGLPIMRAANALRSGDAIEMLTAYEGLQNTER